MQLEEFLRSNSIELYGVIASLKEWLAASVAQIPLTGTMGASGAELEKAQEELEQVIANLETGVRSIHEQLIYYHSTRGKLYVKLQKRRFYDIARTLS